jgi:hypothetical protein
VLKVCSSNGDTACNSGVDMFRDCEGSEFTLRDGSPSSIYPGGNSGTDGGEVEEDKSEDAGSVEDPADSNDEVGVFSCFSFDVVAQRVLVVVVALPLPSVRPVPPSLPTPRPLHSTLRVPSFLRCRNLLQSHCLITASHRVFPITLVAKLLIRRTTR